MAEVFSYLTPIITLLVFLAIGISAFLVSIYLIKKRFKSSIQEEIKEQLQKERF